METLEETDTVVEEWSPLECDSRAPQRRRMEISEWMGNTGNFHQSSVNDQPYVSYDEGKVSSLGDPEDGFFSRHAADNEEGGGDGNPRRLLDSEGAEDMTWDSAATPPPNCEGPSRPSTANSEQNSSCEEDESRSSGSGSSSSSSSSLSGDSTSTSLESNEVEGGSSVTQTADASQTFPGTVENSALQEVALGSYQAEAQLQGYSAREEVVLDSHQAEVQPRGSQAQSDRCHLSMNCIGSTSSSSSDFTADDKCPPHGSVAVCGRRREMEDAVASIPSFLSAPCDTSQCDCGIPCSTHFHFFGVYDGHGGSQAALYCADRLHVMLAEEMTTVMGSTSSEVDQGPDSWDLKWRKAMSNCFLRMDAEVGGVCWRGEECGKPEGSTKCCTDPIAPETVGSTAVVAVVSNCQLILANCGDSRAVLSRGGHAIALSDDHKPEREDELARVEAAGGSVICWDGYRVLGVLAMSRAIGDRYLKPFIIADPEVTCTPRTEEDECLILASDGLWDVMSNDTVCDIARKCLAKHSRNKVSVGANESPSGEGTEDSPAAKAAALLTKLALGRGSTDNISVVVVDLRTVPTRPG